MATLWVWMWRIVVCALLVTTAKLLEQLLLLFAHRVSSVLKALLGLPTALSVLTTQTLALKSPASARFVTQAPTAPLSDSLQWTRRTLATQDSCAMVARTDPSQLTPPLVTFAQLALTVTLLACSTAMQVRLVFSRALSRKMLARTVRRASTASVVIRVL